MAQKMIEGQDERIIQPTGQYDQKIVNPSFHKNILEFGQWEVLSECINVVKKFKSEYKHSHRNLIIVQTPGIFY